MSSVDEKDQRLIEYSVEAVIIAWLVYLFLYQNFLLHTWHRGLPLPPKLPFAVFGIIAGALFFWYEWRRFEKELERKGEVPLKSILPVALKGENTNPGEPSEEKQEGEGVEPVTGKS
ncbi:hypothetical protein [Thermococcus thioreducens]|uniref:hypothetical protein n=1 Tax=Thermococcus thioreducens TaxID=277988 RepID=UPI001E61CF46|nr:hypothetical protein [Thermococcus thioreducens]